MSVTASIDAKSIAHDNPPAGFLAQLAGPGFLDAGKYPQMSFRSTKVAPTGADSADVTGDLTLHGVTRPVTLKVVYNGGYPGMALDSARAHGLLRARRAQSLRLRSERRPAARGHDLRRRRSRRYRDRD